MRHASLGPWRRHHPASRNGSAARRTRKNEIQAVVEKRREITKNLRRLRDDSDLLEAGAVGLAGLDVEETSAGASDLTGAVVTTAVGGDGGGGEREENGGLHLCRLCCITERVEESKSFGRV